MGGKRMEGSGILLHLFKLNLSGFFWIIDYKSKENYK